MTRPPPQWPRTYGNAVARGQRPDVSHLDDDAMVRHVRRTLGCTWVDLADALGVSVDAVHRWKKGESPIPPRRRARLLAIRSIVLTDRLWIVTFDKDLMPPKRRTKQPTTNPPQP